MLPSSSLRLSNTKLLNSHSRNCIRHFQRLSTQYAAQATESHLKKPGLHNVRSRATDTSIERLTNDKRLAFVRSITDMPTEAARAQHDDSPFLDSSSDDVDMDWLTYFKGKEKAAAAKVKVAPGPEILEVLDKRLPELEAKLFGPEDVSSRASSLALTPENTGTEGDTLQKKTLWVKPRKQVKRLERILKSKYLNPADAGSASLEGGSSSLLSDAEWCQLSEACLDAGDANAAEIVFELMKLDGLSPSSGQRDSVLNWYAIRGLTKEADAHIANEPLNTLRDRQRDLLVKVRVNAKQISEAQSILFSLEKLETPAPVQSYTRVIKALLKRPPEVNPRYNKDRAWNTFMHMRFLPEHQPDSLLYSILIRGEIRPNYSLEIFKEMTANGIAPTAEIYDSLICQCSTDKQLYAAAFKLALEMIDAHNTWPKDITPLRPSGFTLSALMQIARRQSNLPHARWVYTQMLRSARDVDDPNGPPFYVRADSMQNLFFTYSMFLPKPDDAETSGLPQSREEILKEVNLIWEQMVSECTATDSASGERRIFSHLILGPKLINSYMSVHYAHCPPVESYRLYATLFQSMGIHRDPYTNMNALEMYAWRASFMSHEESDILPFAWKIWNDWMAFEKSDIRLYDGLGAETQVRVIARAWAAMIRILALTDNLKTAELHLRQFVHRYPPDHMKETLAASSDGLNFKTPFEPAAQVPPGNVMPSFSWPDLALLYRRALIAKHSTLVIFIDELIPDEKRTRVPVKLM